MNTSIKLQKLIPGRKTSRNTLNITITDHFENTTSKFINRWDNIFKKYISNKLMNTKSKDLVQ